MHPDFKELIATFNAENVEYLIVGAHALAAHGFVRATKDLDVWVRPEASNAVRVMQALRVFGAPLHDLTVEDLSVPGVVFQMGVAPIRIDVLTEIDGVSFEDAWPKRLPAMFGDVPASFLSRDHLVVNKRAAGRDQDLVDLKRLEEKK